MSIEITQKYGKGVTYKGEDGNLYFKDEAGNVTSFTDPDQLVKISSDDTTASYLESKLVAGSNVTLTTNNSGGNETITIAAAADNDEKAKVSANDTTSGYLDGKLVAGSGITLTQNNDGGNETLTITANVADTNDKARVSANDTTPGYLNGKLVAGANVTFTEGNDGGDETLTIAAAGGVTGFTGSQNTASPNNTVNASQLLVDATSTNADFVIQPKGTGALLAQLPNGASSGGNKRGAQALDLQMSRSINDRVASGLLSVAIGDNGKATGVGGVSIGNANESSGTRSYCIGRDNKATSTGSVAIGDFSTASGQRAVSVGYSNLSSGDYSFTAGVSNTASGIGSIAVGGANTQGNTASGNNSFVGGLQSTSSGNTAFAYGSACTASGAYSFATGSRAVANKWGMVAHSAGEFSVAGDCQYEQYHLRRLTTNNSQHLLSIDGADPASFGGYMSIASDATYTFSGLVTARRTDADNESGCWKIEGGIDNNAGTTAFVGTPIVTALGDDSAGVWDVTVDADDTNDALVIKVTGENGKTIRWGATVTLMKVAG